MAKNFVQPGDTLSVAAPYAVNAGEGVLIGGLFGVALGNAALAEKVDIKMSGVFDLAAPSNHVFAVGANVYFDVDAKVCRSHGDEDSNSAFVSEALIGSAVAAKPSGATTVRVRLGQPVALV